MVGVAAAATLQVLVPRSLLLVVADHPDGDPTPVVETGDSFGELPRFTYRLDQVELERVRAELAEAGLASSTLVPRRLRATRTKWSVAEVF